MKTIFINQHIANKLSLKHVKFVLRGLHHWSCLLIFTWFKNIIDVLSHTVINKHWSYEAFFICRTKMESGKSHMHGFSTKYRCWGNNVRRIIYAVWSRCMLLNTCWLAGAMYLMMLDACACMSYTCQVRVFTFRISITCYTLSNIFIWILSNT